MAKELTLRDLVFGAAGTLLGGILVWLVTKNIEDQAEIHALESALPQLAKAIATSSRAEEAAKAAQLAADEVMSRANKSFQNVKKIEIEAGQKLSDINATPLFRNVEKSMEELRQIARESAKKASLEYFALQPISHYEVTSKYGHSEEKALGEYQVCSIAGFAVNYAATGNTKICRTELRVNKWFLSAKSEPKGNLTCWAVCQ